MAYLDIIRTVDILEANLAKTRGVRQFIISVNYVYNWKILHHK